jgi:hypothetical protein
MTVTQLLDEPGSKILGACPATVDIDTSNWVRTRSGIGPFSYLLPPGSSEQGIDDYPDQSLKRQTYYIPGILANQASEVEFYAQLMSPILPLPINLVAPVDAETVLSCTETVSGLTASVILCRRQGTPEYGGNFALDLQPNIQVRFSCGWDVDARIPESTLAILRSISPVS